MRYGVWDTNHMKRLLTQRSIIQWKQYTLPDTLISLYIMQAVEMIKNGVRLSPPPGCPRAIYELMIQCWWVCIVYVIFAYITIAFRHPEASGRPSFSTLLSRLSQPENQLLKWTDTITHDPQSTMLGAPLKTASDLHSDLQQQYIN